MAGLMADDSTGLLTGFKILETGCRLAGAVCGRMFAELGAEVIRIEASRGDEDPDPADHFMSQNVCKRGQRLNLRDGGDRAQFNALARDADLIISSWDPEDARSLMLQPHALRVLNASAVLVYVTPFGLDGPDSGLVGSDIVVFHTSGLARLLIGEVDDPEVTPPVRAAGQQSEFVAGIAAACAAMQGLFRKEQVGVGALIDVSMQEALAYMDVAGLAAPAFGEGTKSRRRDRIAGPRLAILPAADGFVAISPREEHQWQQMLDVIGNPEWARDARFATREAREANAEVVIKHLSEWSRNRKKEEIFRAAQAERVPCFPFMTPGEHLASKQLKHRDFFRHLRSDTGGRFLLPGTPYGLPKTDSVPAIPYDRARAGSASSLKWVTARRTAVVPKTATRPTRDALPLRGVRVADLSWVFAGPLCTRYLAAMGAEVVKVETAKHPASSRAGIFHDVLGQTKRSVSLDLKSAAGLAVMKKLVSKSDVVVENFAPGVMGRLGLSWEELQRIRPDLVMLSASGMGQTGPEADVVAYGTLLQVYTGFASLNGFRGAPPSIGMVWSDPLCGLLMAFSVVAALRRSRATGVGRHVDFSMVEAILTTMPGALLEHQMNRTLGPNGNDDPEYFPHGVFRCRGEDAWLAIAVTGQREWRSLSQVIGLPEALRDLDVKRRRARAPEILDLVEKWTRSRDAHTAMRDLQAMGVPAGASLSNSDLAKDPHLRQRRFFQMLPDRVGQERLLPTLPWRWCDGEPPQYRAAPGLGQHTVEVLRDLLGFSDAEINAMQAAGALT